MFSELCQLPKTKYNESYYYRILNNLCSYPTIPSIISLLQGNQISFILLFDKELFGNTAKLQQCQTNNFKQNGVPLYLLILETGFLSISPKIQKTSLGVDCKDIN